MRFKPTVVWLACAFITSAGHVVFAQAVGGSIQGMVTDPTGAIVRSASVASSSPSAVTPWSISRSRSDR